MNKISIMSLILLTILAIILAACGGAASDRAFSNLTETAVEPFSLSLGRGRGPRAAGSWEGEGIAEGKSRDATGPKESDPLTPCRAERVGSPTLARRSKRSRHPQSSREPRRPPPAGIRAPGPCETQPPRLSSRRRRVPAMFVLQPQGRRPVRAAPRSCQPTVH